MADKITQFKNCECVTHREIASFTTSGVAAAHSASALARRTLPTKLPPIELVELVELFGPKQQFIVSIATG